MEFRQEAGLMVQTNSKVNTPALLAEHLLDPAVRRYRQGEETRRKRWLFRQIGACHVLVHTRPESIPQSELMTIDTDILDAAMIEDPVIANLTATEIQDAFRAGVTGAYGDFYGITPKSLLGFLKSYCSSEKKLDAHRLITIRSEKEDREANERLWKEIQEMKKKGIYVPSWGPNYDFKKKTSPQDSEAHKERIRQQREEILKHSEK